MAKAFKCSLSRNTVAQAQDIPGYIGVLDLPSKRYLIRAWVLHTENISEIAYLDILRRKSGRQQIWPADIWSDHEAKATWAPQQLGQVFIDNNRFGIGIWQNTGDGKEVGFDLSFVPIPAGNVEADGQGRGRGVATNRAGAD